jgi:hypothetical protein
LNAEWRLKLRTVAYGMSLSRSAHVASICTIALAVGSVSVSALSTDARISRSGLGAIKLGMTERQIERAAKRPIKLSASRGSDCALATLAPGRKGSSPASDCDASTSLRPDLQQRRASASAQPRSGSSPLTPACSRASRQKFADDDNLVLSKDNRKVVFSLADGKVSEISTGRTPEIDLVERCS